MRWLPSKAGSSETLQIIHHIHSIKTPQTKQEFCNKTNKQTNKLIITGVPDLRGNSQVSQELEEIIFYRAALNNFWGCKICRAMILKYLLEISNYLLAFTGRHIVLLDVTICNNTGNHNTIHVFTHCRSTRGSSGVPSNSRTTSLFFLFLLTVRLPTFFWGSTCSDILSVTPLSPFKLLQS